MWRSSNGSFSRFSSIQTVWSGKFFSILDRKALFKLSKKLILDLKEGKRRALKEFFFCKRFLLSYWYINTSDFLKILIFPSCPTLCPSYSFLFFSPWFMHGVRTANCPLALENAIWKDTVKLKVQPAIPLLVRYHRETNTCAQRGKWKKVFIAALHE